MVFRGKISRLVGDFLSPASDENNRVYDASVRVAPKHPLAACETRFCWKCGLYRNVTRGR